MIKIVLSYEDNYIDRVEKIKEELHKIKSNVQK